MTSGSCMLHILVHIVYSLNENIVNDSYCTKDMNKNTHTIHFTLLSINKGTLEACSAVNIWECKRQMSYPQYIPRSNSEQKL